MQIEPSKAQPIRDVQEITLDLERLCQEEGFIYTFSFIVFSSLCVAPEELSEIDWFERPNHQELSFLLGLMVKHPLSLDLPTSEEVLLEQNCKAHDLLEELHKAHIFVNAGESAFSNLDTSEKMVAFGKNYGEWIETGQGMVEPIFYGGEGACIFQHLEMAAKRYEGDREWIARHLGTSLVVSQICF